MTVNHFQVQVLGKDVMQATSALKSLTPKLLNNSKAVSLYVYLGDRTG